MEKIIEEFREMRSRCYHWEEPYDSGCYRITVREVFYDCLVNEGQAFPKEQVFEFPGTEDGARQALRKFEEGRNIIYGKIRNCRNGEAGVEGEDFSIRDLPHSLWALIATEDDFIEAEVSFPDYFNCCKAASQDNIIQ